LDRPPNAGDPHQGEAGYEGHYGPGLVAAYLRMVRLCIAEQNVAEARQWQTAPNASCVSSSHDL